MKRTTFLKKAKKLGLTVEENQRRCYIRHNGTIASWFWQEHYLTKELEGTNWHTKGEHQESDPYTDYFPGSFWDNATQMLSRLVPPGSKHKVGSLLKSLPMWQQLRNLYYSVVVMVLVSLVLFIRQLLQWVFLLLNVVLHK